MFFLCPIFVEMMSAPFEDGLYDPAFLLEKDR